MPRDIHLFRSGRSDELLGDLGTVFASADLAVVNLECPLVEQPSPVPKTGKHLSASPNCLTAFQAAGIGVVNLANNHIMDHGLNGLQSTLDACSAFGLVTVGAGQTLEEAARPALFQLKDRRFGILSFAERENGIATPESSGANPIGAIEFARSARDIRDKTDAFVVLLHAGKEHYPYPSPNLQQLCRFMVEEGASAVICQHSHCPGAYETYRDGHIVYGQGNLVFAPHPDPRPALYEGYLVDLTFPAEGGCRFEVVPYIQPIDGLGVRRLDGKDEQAFREKLAAYSRSMSDDAFVRNSWQDLARDSRRLYASVLRGHNRVLRRLNRLFGFAVRNYSHEQLMTLENVLQCETHQELLLSAVTEYVADRTEHNHPTRG